MMEPQFIEITLPAHQSSFFVTDDGGTLRFVLPTFSHNEEEWDEEDIAASLATFSFALGFEQRNEEVAGWDEDSDLCHCRVRVFDSQGTLWEAKTLFNTNVLLENIADCRRDSWAQHSPPSEKLFEEHDLIKGIRGFYDDRSYRCIVVEDKRYAINFKNQYPVFDIAFREDKEFLFDNSRLWVRVSGFYERETGIVPPFYFDMDCETLMFYAETSGLPTPLIFRKIGTSQQKQTIVQYIPSGTSFSSSTG